MWDTFVVVYHAAAERELHKAAGWGGRTQDRLCPAGAAAALWQLHALVGWQLIGESVPAAQSRNKKPNAEQPECEGNDGQD